MDITTCDIMLSLIKSLKSPLLKVVILENYIQAYGPIPKEREDELNESLSE